MAERPAFFHHRGKVVSKRYGFEWFPGFSAAQKQRCVESLHHAILETDAQARPLEVSTKSKVELGRKLSAFHLKLHGAALENVFQSAKVFEQGGPYLDLLQVQPKEAKRDPRLRDSGSLKGFCYQGQPFPLLPQTAFYDYIYLAAVKESLGTEEIRLIQNYNYFTDIEFNPAKSINTQARSVAILRLLLEEYGHLPDVAKEDFLAYHREHVTL